MQIKGFTSVARVLDPRYPTNLAIAVITFMVGALTFLLGSISGNAFIENIIQGTLNAGSVFAAWAIAREIDPDHELSAFVAAGVATLLVVAIDNTPVLLPLIWLVLAIRAINRTTGLAPTLLDTITILALGTWLGFTESWAYLAATALTLVFVSVSSEHPHRLLAFGAFATVFAVVSFIVEDTTPQAEAALLALGMSLLFIPVLASSAAPTSTADFTGIPLEGRRVQAGQVLALSAGSLIALWGGLYDLQSLWAAVLGSSLYWALAIMRLYFPKLVQMK